MRPLADARETTIHDVVGFLWSQRLVIFAAVAFAVGAALTLSARQQPQYTSTAALAVDDLSQDLALVGVFGGVSETPAALALRKSQTLLRPETLDTARRQLDPQPTVAALRRSLETSTEPASSLILVKATATTATSAAATANAVAAAAARQETKDTRRRFAVAAADLRRRYRSLPAADRRDGPTRNDYKQRISRLDSLAAVASPMRIAEKARAPERPVSLTRPWTAIIAGFVGLITGLGIAYLRRALDRRVRGATEITQLLDLPLVGYVREEAMGMAGAGTTGPRLLADMDIEGFHIIRANLQFLIQNDDEVTTVLVTSPLPAEGKSTVAASLAFALAQSGKRTLLLECDLRRPSLAGRLGLAASPGLAELISADATLSEALHVLPVDAPSSNGAGAAPLSDASVSCILAGSVSGRAAALLASAQFAKSIDELRAGYDIVLLDSAPLLPVVDTLELLPLADAAILCIRDGCTTRDQAEAAKSLMANMRSRPVAVVVTGVKPGSSHGYGGYAYAYSAAYAPQT